MKTWFDNLNSRERTIVVTGLVLASIIIVWGIIWKPLTGATADLRDTVAEKGRLISDLRRAEGIRQTAGSTVADAATTQTLISLIDTTARPHGLVGTFTRTRPNGPNEISVSFQRAPFNVLVSWLIELEQSFGIRVDSASFSVQPQPGLVNGQLALSRI